MAVLCHARWFANSTNAIALAQVSARSWQKLLFIFPSFCLPTFFPSNSGKTKQLSRTDLRRPRLLAGCERVLIRAPPPRPQQQPFLLPGRWPAGRLAAPPVACHATGIYLHLPAGSQAVSVLAGWLAAHAARHAPGHLSRATPPAHTTGPLGSVRLPKKK